MRKKLTVVGLLLGFVGASLLFVDCYRTSSRFTVNSVALGFGAAHDTWFWRYSGEVGFAMIALAFFIELLVVLCFKPQD